MREQSGQKCTWEKGKGRPRCEKMQVPEGQNRDFLVREHREIRLGGWGGTRLWRVLNAMLNTWALCGTMGKPGRLLRGLKGGLCKTDLTVRLGWTDWRRREAGGHSTPTGTHWPSVYTLRWQWWEQRECDGDRTDSKALLRKCLTVLSLASQIQRKP